MKRKCLEKRKGFLKVCCVMWNAMCYMEELMNSAIEHKLLTLNKDENNIFKDKAAAYMFN